MGKYAGSMPGGAQRIPGWKPFKGSPENYNLGIRIGKLLEGLPTEPKERFRREITRMYADKMEPSDILRVVTEPIKMWKANSGAT